MDATVCRFARGLSDGGLRPISKSSTMPSVRAGALNAGDDARVAPPDRIDPVGGPRTWRRPRRATSAKTRPGSMAPKSRPRVIAASE